MPRSLTASLSPQGSQDATAPPEAMAQPYPPTQYPPPPQNGVPAEYAPPPPHPTQDYSGQPPVPPEHSLTLYTPAQTHAEQPGPDAGTQAGPGAPTVPVRPLCCSQSSLSRGCPGDVRPSRPRTPLRPPISHTALCQGCRDPLRGRHPVRPGRGLYPTIRPRPQSGQEEPHHTLWGVVHQSRHHPNTGVALLGPAPSAAPIRPL